MTPQQEHLVHYMPIVVRASGLSDYDRKFCASMIRQSRRKSTGKPWVPSERQTAVMERIVDKFRRENLAGDDVIEGED